MRKHIVLVLLVPILALTLISCDADMRSSFANFLGGLGGNVYVDGGLVEPNKADVKAATDTIAGLGSGNGAQVFDAGDAGKTDTFGIEVDIPAGVTTVMKPQLKEDQDKLKDDLANTLNSPQQTAELKEELKKPVSDPGRKKAVQGTVEVFNATIDALASELDNDPDKKELKEAIDKLKLDTIAEGDEITEGDVLLVQLMTNLVSNTIGTLNNMVGDGGEIKDADLAANKDKLLSVIDDALFTAQVASDLVGASNLNLLEGLDLSAIGRGSRKSREGDSDNEFKLDEVGEYISIVNSLGPKLVRLFGLKLIGGEYDWEIGDYRRMISNFQVYRLSLEHALAFYRAGSLESINQASLDKLDETTPVFYLLSVILTEANAFDKNIGKSLIKGFMNANKKFATGTLTTSDVISYNAEDQKKDFEDFAKWLADDSVDEGRGKDYVKAFFLKTQALDEIGGSGFIGTAIKDFLTKTDDDGKTEFDDFWGELTGEGE